MASDNYTITVKLEIKPLLSWRDAIKLRLAGGKAAEEFWNVLAENLRHEKIHDMADVLKD
jgi:hypothetical protein